MKDKDFEKVWQEEIWPFLQKTEEERKHARDRRMAFALLILGFSLAAALLEHGFEYVWMSLLGIAVGLFAAWKLHTIPKVKYRKKFKSRVITTLSKLTDISWQIHLGDEFSEEEKKAARHKMIFEEEHSLFTKTENEPAKLDLPGNLMRIDGKRVFKEAGLYTNYTSLGCEDKLTARWQHSEIEAYETEVKRKSGRSQVTVFRGFIIKASIDKEFRGETYVQTESDSGTVAGENSWMSFGGGEGVEETELEWIDFEKFLQVKSSDPAEAREIFTPDFMEVMYEWWQGHAEPLRMVFKNQAVYIAYPTKIDLEPRIFGKLEAEKGAVKDTLELLMFVENTIKTLLGGQRLWFDKPLAPQPPRDYE